MNSYTKTVPIEGNIMQKYGPVRTQMPYMPPEPSFSIEPLLDAVGNDIEFAGEMMTLFLHQTPLEIEQLRQLLEREDIVAIKQLLHTQKAVIQTFGLTEAYRLIKVSEALMADNKGIHEIAPMINQYILVLASELPVIQSTLEATFNRRSFD